MTLCFFATRYERFNVEKKDGDEARIIHDKKLLESEPVVCVYVVSEFRIQFAFTHLDHDDLFQVSFLSHMRDLSASDP